MKKYWLLLLLILSTLLSSCGKNRIDEALDEVEQGSFIATSCVLSAQSELPPLPAPPQNQAGIAPRSEDYASFNDYLQADSKHANQSSEDFNSYMNWMLETERLKQEGQQQVFQTCSASIREQEKFRGEALKVGATTEQVQGALQVGIARAQEALHQEK
ncbi:MAG: hypothetical protein HC879_20125 [Leptolyngbyaceae cyanobacterium SL_5_9]|nr:hypothetical protein [Leptolyngbyaceae cyanobacterium SL_5_9]